MNLSLIHIYLAYGLKLAVVDIHVVRDDGHLVGDAGDGGAGDSPTRWGQGNSCLLYTSRCV